MMCWNREQLEQMLFDVVNVLDLSDGMIEEHGPHGTAPAELVRLVLERKDREIAMLRGGMIDVRHVADQRVGAEKSECGACDAPGEHCANVHGVCSRHGGRPAETVAPRWKGGVTSEVCPKCGQHDPECAGSPCYYKYAHGPGKSRCATCEDGECSVHPSSAGRHSESEGEIRG